MKKAPLLFFTFVLVLLVISPIIPSAFALAISGSKLSPITYRSGTTITNHYVISGAEKEIKLSLDKGPFQDITVTEVINNEFDLIINFPADEYIAPGSYSFGLSATEIPDAEGGAINTLVAVSKMFTVDVYSYQKEIVATLTAPNINAGNNVTFQLTVSSLGYPDINSVRGIITVYDYDSNSDYAKDNSDSNSNSAKEIGSVTTAEKSLPGLESVTFYPVFDARNLPAGAYSAKATVYYDGKEKKTNATFLIGNMDISLLNYTAELPPGFSDFQIRVKSNWGNELRNVYALLLLNGENGKEGEELLHTASLNLDPWEAAELKGIVKMDHEPGSYSGIIRIFFEGEHKDFPISIKVIQNSEPSPEAQEPGSSYSLFLSIVIILLVVIAILGYFLLKRMGEPPLKNDF